MGYCITAGNSYNEIRAHIAKWQIESREYG